MKLYRLHIIQRLPISISEAWDFFSNPQNLTVITPPFLRFQITSPLPQKVYPGMLITYRVSPFLGIPINWVTEITHVIEPHLFVDEQRFGPYRFWHHQHHFREIEGGVQVQDLVHYAVRLGPLAGLINRLLVGRQLKRIFDFRRIVLEHMFGAMPDGEKSQDRGGS
jgi:ligand-binding SRPBCC domain-containing protein